MRFLVLDGNSIVNRAFYGIKALMTKDGFYTNAIYGFMNILEKLKAETMPDAVAIAFDLKAPTFRHKAYEGYKAKRKSMPSELAQQLPVLKELLVALGYTLLQCEGYEADDILGTLSRACSEKGYECIIATGDKDSLQLVSEKTTVQITATKFGRPNVTVYDEAKISEEFKVTPKQLIEVKALQGDTSDNIPGVAGIGPKGAIDLISKYKSIENIYNNIDSLEITENLRKKLLQGKENAFLSRMLGTIVTDVPIDLNFDDYVSRGTSEETAVKILKGLEMYSTIEKLGLDINLAKKDDSATQNCDEDKPKTTYCEITDENLLNDVLDKTNKTLYIIAEYNDDKSIKTVCLNIDSKVYSVCQKQLIESFKLKLSSLENICAVVWDAKSLYFSLPKLCCDFSFDILLAAYLLEPDMKKYEIEKLCLHYNLMSNDKAEISPLEKNCAALPKLYECLAAEIVNNNLDDLLKNIEIPFSKVLADMEKQGFKVDKQGIENYDKQISDKIEMLKKDIFNLIGYELNLNSPKQLSKALFEDLKLKPGKKTKGGYSTSAEVLENLKYDHECVALILEYRTLSKLKSTYCEGLLKVIDEDGKIHTTFNQVETRTGRISSLEPNLQNIPVRTEVGRELRKFFTADEGNVLVDADYSQIELRVLAHISDDKNMIDAFNQNKDIHTITASQVFNMPEILVTPMMRTRAKAVNFGIVYGIGAFSLSKDISVSVKQAAQYINDYLMNFKGIDNYMHKVVQQAKENGYVKTLFNRRRYLPELSSSNHNVRAFGERIARNMPIQGTAADIIKIASVNVYKRLKKENLKSKLIMQVHDELIVDAPQNEADIAAKILKEEMENAVSLNVRLTVEVEKGITWYDTKS
ncbi:MAG: DNA polymerase I [Clostridia bacterium]|nr:DNA polymerase I [Clostridia bacterium]